MVLKRVILFKPKIFPVTLFITLNAFSFHSTKAKVLKKEYKAQYDSTPCYLIFCHFSPCLLCSILTDPYQRMFLTQGLWTFNLLYLECSSSKYLYLCSLASFRSLFSHILPSLSLYTVVTAPPLHFQLSLPLSLPQSHALWPQGLCFSHCYSPII